MGLGVPEKPRSCLKPPIWFSRNTVDGRNPANHLTCMKPCKSCDILYRINWIAGILKPSKVWPRCKGNKSSTFEKITCPTSMMGGRVELTLHNTLKSVHYFYFFVWDALMFFLKKNNLTTLFWGGINFISSTNRQPFPGWAAVMSQRRMTWWPRNWSVVWFPETARGFSGNYAPNRGKDTAWWVLGKVVEVKICCNFGS